MRQRICARWGAVQHQAKVFYFVALKFARLPDPHIFTDYDKSCQAVTPGFRNLGPLPPHHFCYWTCNSTILNSTKFWSTHFEFGVDHEGSVAPYLPKFCSRDYFTINYIFLFTLQPVLEADLLPHGKICCLNVVGLQNLDSLSIRIVKLHN